MKDKESLTKKLVGLIMKFNNVDKEINFSDAKLNDGTTIVRLPNTPPLKGDVVTVITPDGEVAIPDSAPETPYVLEDGTSFTVVGGLVDVVTVVEAEEDKKEETAVVAEPVKQEVVAPKRIVKSQVEEHIFSVELENEIIEFDFSKIFAKNENELKTLKTKFATQIEINAELVKTIEAIGNEPATVGVEFKKIKPAVTKKYSEMTNVEKMKFNRGEL